MSNTKPKVWDTPFIQKPNNMSKVTYSTSWDIMDYLNDYQAQVLTPREHAPDYLYFEYYNLSEKQKISLPDMFKITGGFIVISERFHELLQEFDLGQTQFFEVPLYEYNQKNQRPGRWFILHIAEHKEALVPEECTGLITFVKGGDKWLSNFGDDTVAVLKNVALAGVDLWMDPRLNERIFLSDRLKIAIKDHKIKATSMKMKPTKLI